MRNILIYTSQRMSLLANKGILLLWGIIVACIITLAPFESDAAIGTTTQNWPATPIYSLAAYPSAGISYNAVAGNNRLLVVGISSSNTAAVAQAQPTVTYGGTSMTYAIGYSATATQQHSYLFYLPLGSSATADTGKTIVVSISGGTSAFCMVNAAVYIGVDQSAPLGTSVRWSNNITASNAVGPFTLAVNSGELGISVLNAVRTTRANAPTITLGATGHIWSQISTAASGKIAGSLRTTFATTSNVNSVTATQHTTTAQGGAATLNSSAAITIKPLMGVTVANGSTVAGNKSVYVNDGANSGNVVVDAFSMTADANTNVTSITFTGNANTTNSRVSWIKIWRKVGGTLAAWEASDIQVGSTIAANGGAVTFSGFSEAVTTVTKNYIVTFDIDAAAPASTATVLTGTITAITPAAISLTDTSALSASIYIYPTTTLGTGTEPAAVRLSKGSAATNLDAFTLVHNSSLVADNDAVTTVTVTLTPQYISGGSGGTISKIKLIEVVNSAGTVVYGSSNAATSGDLWNIATSGLSATSTLATYYVRVSTADTITPSVTDTSGTPLGYYVFSGRVTAVAHGSSSNMLILNDSAGQTLEIDVEKPIGPATATASTGSTGGEINLVWDAGSDANGGALDATTPYIVRRSAPDGTQPSPGCTDGNAVTLSPANQSGRSLIDTGLIDTTPTRYYYRVCSKDSQGNISDGAASYANAKVTNICNTTPSVTLTGEDSLSLEQVIKSANTTPFKLMIANNDIGSCPDVGFNLALVNELNSVDFDKTVGATPETAVTFPATVTLGTGGGGAPTGKTLNVYITGKPSVQQLEFYKFALQVTGTGHGTPPETSQVTGVLNDMPPIVHNSNNMGKFQYGNWGQNFTCATCHSNSTTNIKGVYQIISTSYSRRRSVIFTKTSSTESDYVGVYSNDQRPDKNTSNNICSVCHHRTRQHQYSASKPFGGPDNDEPYVSDHHNSRDCINCHTHNTAFRSIYGLCGDCHGFKATGYSPINKNTMVKDLTNALGPSPPNYGSHQRHTKAGITCAACHSNTNHGLATMAWQGDNFLEIGFNANKDTFPGFNPSATASGGTFYGTNNLNTPFTWKPGADTSIVQIGDYNASCNTYCHGQWAGNAGSNTSPIWVGTGQVACGTCHYASGAVPPASGSHTKHALTSGAGLGIPCMNCHATYSTYTGSAHVNGNVEWSMTAYPDATYKGANAGSTGAKAPTASINYGICANLYCHSNVQGEDGTGNPTSYAAAKWGDPSTAACGSCHVQPNTTGSHQSHENVQVAFDCHVCHNTGGTTSPLNHGNGKIDFKFVGLGQNTRYMGISSGMVSPGTPYGTCSNSDCHGRYTRKWGTLSTGLTLCDKCHGSATSPRGFYNTRGPDGTLSIYSTAIGVHDIHLQNPNSPRKATFARFTSYAKSLSCRQCHAVPNGPFTSGHIDTALPAEVPFSHVSSIANTGKIKFSYYTSPAYTGGAQTCSAVWCHGAGMNSNNSSGPYAGLASTVERQIPKWDTPFLTGNGATDCVKCHAMPPPAPDANYIHFEKTLANCKDCHVHLTDDGLGFKDKSLHINGKIDGGCDTCHGYPPINNIVGDKDGLATPAQGALRLGTAGAHQAHVSNPNIRKVCQTCHYSYTVKMPSNDLEIGFNAYNGTVTSGTFTGYSNSGLHPNWTPKNAGTTINKVTSGANVCSNLYCHGGGTATLPALGGGIKTDPNWEGGSAEVSCGSCHGSDTTNAPSGGPHQRHALANNGGIGLLCNACHGSSLNMTHVNGAVSWKLDRSNPAIGANATYNSISSGSITGLAPRNNGADYHFCNNVYCHSNVQGANGVGAPTFYATPKWGDPPLNCGSCHTNMATDAAATGSHKKHANTGGANMALSCGYCHKDGGDGSINHGDNLIFLNFTSYVGGTYSNNNRSAGSAAGYGSCSATFCHGTNASPAWGSAGPLACTACHGASSDITLSPSWSGRHTTHYNYSSPPGVYNETLSDLSNNTRYRFNCTHCHDSDSSKHSLKPYSSSAYARVFFGITSAGTSARRGKYVYGAAGATDNGFKYTAGSCNTSYCHSDGKKGAPLVTTLTWTTPKIAGSNCLYCHDNKSITGTASKLSPRHDKHMNPTNNTMIGTGNGFNCVNCHAKTVFKNLSVGNKANHLNGMVDYSGVKAGKTFDASTKVCSNVYCHSNGNPNALVFVNMTGSKVWSGAGATGTITTCNKCHGRSNAYGYPDYANGGASSVTSNLHAGHMAGMADTTACSDCHRKTPDTLTANKFRPYSTLHLSGVPNVYFNTAKIYVGTKATLTVSGAQNLTLTCSQIVCHGQGAPIWGSSTTVGTCQKCHGSRATAFQTVTSAQVAPGYGSDGTDTSMTNKAPTDPRVGAHQRHLVSNVITSVVKCSECHLKVSSIRDGNHWNYSTATLTFNGRATASSHVPTVSRTAGIMQCSNTSCHTGKSNSGTTVAPFWNMTGLVKEGTLTVASCQKCHGFPPKSVGPGGTALSYNHTSVADPSSFPVTTCTGCHANMSKTSTSYADIFVDKTLHVNGIINAASMHAFPYPGATHASPAGTTPWTACNSCHTTSGNTTYPVTAGTAPDCTGCHKNGLKTPSGTSSCWDCHGATAADGRPNGNVFPNYSGSHTKHVVGQSMACSACHATYGGNIGDTRHGFSNRTAHTFALGFVNVTSTTAQFKYAKAGKGTCSNVACHNGTAEWGVTKLACNSCHSYLATDPWTTTYSIQGIGAHVKHINYLTARYGITLNAANDLFGSGNSAAVCGVCHSITLSDHSMSKTVNTRTINFGGSTAHRFEAGTPTYNGATGTSSAVNPKSCSNIDCHYLTSPIWTTY